MFGQKSATCAPGLNRSTRMRIQLTSQCSDSPRHCCRASYASYLRTLPLSNNRRANQRGVTIGADQHTSPCPPPFPLNKKTPDSRTKPTLLLATDHTWPAQETAHPTTWNHMFKLQNGIVLGRVLGSSAILRMSWVDSS